MKKTKWVNEDGHLNFEALDQLEANLRAVTDNMSGIDGAIRAGRAGVERNLAFRCGHSGKLFPADYVKEWGRLYGIGLGPEPVSECLDSEYHCDPGQLTPDIRRIEQLMHPLVTTKAQVDLDWVDTSVVPRKVGPALASDQYLILAKDDMHMEKRAPILYARQLVNPKSKLRNMHAAWSQAGRKAAE